MKESNAVTSAKTKQITPELIERALTYLDETGYCCHALSCEIDDCTFTWVTEEDIETAENFFFPLLERDNITNDGSWRCADNLMKAAPCSREEWLRKIAQELREGKI